MNKSDNFPQKVKVKIAQRAGYICSNPQCSRLTIGPSMRDYESSENIGVAAHICAASPGGPRYDFNQSENERKGIENAIHLCASCSVLIDRNNGIDYPKELLQKWKHDHEKIIKKNLEGTHSVLMSIRDEEVQFSKEVVTILEDKGSLFIDLLDENREYVILSISDIRNNLVKIKGKVKNKNFKLEKFIKLILDACRDFMNNTSITIDCNSFLNNLKILRKTIGIILLEIENEYNITIDFPLKSIVPIFENNY